MQDQYIIKRALLNTGLLFAEEEVALIDATITPFSLDLCKLIAQHPAMTVHSLIEAKQIMQSLLDGVRSQ